MKTRLTYCICLLLLVSCSTTHKMMKTEGVYQNTRMNQKGKVQIATLKLYDVGLMEATLTDKQEYLGEWSYIKPNLILLEYLTFLNPENPPHTIFPFDNCEIKVVNKNTLQLHHADSLFFIRTTESLSPSRPNKTPQRDRGPKNIHRN